MLHNSKFFYNFKNMIISKILTGKLSIPHMCSKLIIHPYPGKTFFRLCTLLFTITSTFLNAQTLQQKLDKYLEEYHSQKYVASISAGVLKKNKIIWLGSTVIPI